MKRTLQIGFFLLTGMLVPHLVWAQAKVSVTSLNGTIQAKKGTDKQWSALKKGSELAKGLQIRTEGGSAIEMRWGDRAVIKLLENSVLTIQEISDQELDILLEIGKTTIDFKGVKGTVLVLSSPSSQIWAKKMAKFTAEVTEDFSTHARVEGGVIIAKALDVVKPALVKADHKITMKKGYLGKPANAGSSLTASILTGPHSAAPVRVTFGLSMARIWWPAQMPTSGMRAAAATRAASMTFCMSAVCGESDWADFGDRMIRPGSKLASFSGVTSV